MSVGNFSVAACTVVGCVVMHSARTEKKKSRVTLYVFVQAKEYVLRLTTCHSAVLYCMYGYILVCTYLKFSYCHNHELFFFFFLLFCREQSSMMAFRGGVLLYVVYIHVLYHSLDWPRC